ncbi:Dehydrogenase reductase SDR family member 7B [Fusarium napiforme]|uniref:Dehydrogenase reductase SDR family member 7B n=1 Tax=Fusarium napiforme TaxID=42672 RepID=A0A8H5JN19_9HYPO|nr:Dehydrogenase reductase SDR family member 7B [Fusarium napiforme]
MLRLRVPSDDGSLRRVDKKVHLLAALGWHPMSCVALATGDAKDALSGSYYDVEQDLEDIIAQAALLKEDPLLHRLNISMLGALEREEGAIAQEPEEKFDFPGF